MMDASMSEETSVQISLPSQAGSSSGQNMPRSNRRVSCFDATRMPADSIRKRELHAFSVHYSVATSKWIATLARPSVDHCNHSDEKRRCVSFPFATEREARKFAKVYSPPKMMENATRCVCCNMPFNDETKCRAYNCRNCGSQVCDKCSTRWGIRMIPKTYISSPNSAMTVRVCKSCDWLSNAFCMALLRGSYHDAIRIHSTGNVNLRCTFADISREAMFPIHCAVMGGNVELVKWLVEKEDCPLSVRRDPKSGMLCSVQTSARRTLIDLAMTGKPKIEILSFLIQNSLSIVDAKDPKLAPKTLETLLGAGFRFEKREGEVESFQLVESCDTMSIGTLEDACIICCEKQMDCVLTPCGHQMCCSQCGEKMTACPYCKKGCSILKIFRL
mmetsp:Transcript_32033/g.91343  ORF Transcript_32033/g.91343 Transcript_32033/m.91343 type:complete len:388 (-) Transcript_32033:183-1346(-)